MSGGTSSGESQKPVLEERNRLTVMDDHSIMTTEPFTSKFTALSTDGLMEFARPVKGFYPDGVPFLKLDLGRSMSHTDIQRFGQLIVQSPKLEDTILAAGVVRDIARRRKGVAGLPAPILGVPYLPGARQDKGYAGSGTDAASIAQVLDDVFRGVIEAGGVVWTLDRHSILGSTPVRGFTNYLPFAVPHFLRTLFQLFRPTSIVAPDAGGEDRAYDCRARASADLWLSAPTFQFGFAAGIKQRDRMNGRILYEGVRGLGDLGPRPLIVDDICDGGASFKLLAEFIRRNAPTPIEKMGLFVTHGLFTKGIDELRGHFDKIITTDSLGVHRYGVWGIHGVVREVARIEREKARKKVAESFQSPKKDDKEREEEDSCQEA